MPPKFRASSALKSKNGGCRIAAGKLIDDLIASEQRHRITGGQIEYGAAKFFLSGRGDLNVQPQANAGAKQGDSCQRNANASNADSVGSQRNQFIVGRQTAEHQQYGS